MAKGDGRQKALGPAQMSDFGRRLEEEFHALGYLTRADQERACSGFDPSRYPAAVGPSHIRAWLTGSLPRLDSAEVLEAIGIDLHYCRTGQRRERPCVRPADGFNLMALFQRYDGLPVSLSILWSASETLFMADFLKDRRGQMATERDVAMAFEETLRLRAEAGGHAHVVPTNQEQLDEAVVNLGLWYSMWSAHFSIVGAPLSVDRLRLIALQLSLLPRSARSAA